MSNKYFIKTGLNEFSMNPNFNDDNVKVDDISIGSSEDKLPDNSSDSKNPFVSVTPAIGLSAKGQSTGQTSKSKSALGGYEEVTVEKGNSEIIDKTPENSELNNPSQLKNDDPSTESDEHPHQIENGEVEKTYKTETDITAPSEVGSETPDIMPAGMPENDIPEPDENQDAISIKVDENLDGVKNNGKRGNKIDVDEEMTGTHIEDENVCTGCGCKLPANLPYPTCNSCSRKKDKKSDNWIGEGNDSFPVGSKAKISGGSGVDSDKTVTIVDKSNVVTTGAGTPSNVKGAYKPVDWSREVAIQYEDGSFGTMFKNRLTPIKGEPVEQECKSCGCGKFNTEHDKIKKLQTLQEKLSRKPFLTMKDILLLTETKKILKIANGK